MAQGRSRPAWAEIDLAAVAHNAAVLARLAAPAELCAVVKADGYGHGGPAVARAALAGGAHRLAVALVDEGVELREHGVDGPVLLLERVRRRRGRGRARLRPHADGVHRRGRRGLRPRPPRRPGVAPRSTSRSTPACTGWVPRPRTCRRWWRPSHASRRWRSRASGRIWPVADGVPDEDRAFTEAQLDRFDAAWPASPRRLRRPLLHAANTAGAIAFPRSRYDMVRCGIGLYGYLPGPAVRRAFDAQAGGEGLRPPCRSRRGWSRCGPRGRRAPVLRPAAARCRHALVVATVPIGYADGVPRAPLRRRLRGARSAACAGRWPGW